MFFIDFVGHHRDPLIKAVLEQISQEAVALKGAGLVSEGGALIQGRWVRKAPQRSPGCLDF